MASLDLQRDRLTTVVNDRVRVVREKIANEKVGLDARVLRLHHIGAAENIDFHHRDQQSGVECFKRSGEGHQPFCGKQGNRAGRIHDGHHDVGFRSDMPGIRDQGKMNLDRIADVDHAPL